MPDYQDVLALTHEDPRKNPIAATALLIAQMPDNVSVDSVQWLALESASAVALVTDTRGNQIRVALDWFGLAPDPMPVPADEPLIVEDTVE